MHKEIIIQHDSVELKGNISGDEFARGWVIFAHGSGSSHKSVRNNWVAGKLNAQGFGTLLFDLLTQDEDRIYENRFNLPLLASRLITATQWLINSNFYRNQPMAYFGASTGAGAALIAATKADPSWPLSAIISRGGRPDLAGKETLVHVTQPVLLIVGSQDKQVIHLNELALAELPQAQLTLVPGATHLFEERGTLEEVVQLTLHWLEMNLFHNYRQSDLEL